MSKFFGASRLAFWAVDAVDGRRFAMADEVVGLEDRTLLSATDAIIEYAPKYDPNLHGPLEKFARAPESALFPLGETFNLSSRPSATKTIYLDFTGHVTTGTAWNTGTGNPTLTTAPYTTDADPAFSDNELMNIQEIWARVVEDYSPFDVNVTTVDPPVGDLINSGGGDQRWGIRVLIGVFTPDVYTSAGGVAYIGSFNWDSDTPTLVFPNRLGSPKNIAEATSHEVGHTLGLGHDGRTTPVEDYYTGHGTGATGWAPIMGVGYGRQYVTFSKGEYLNANNSQDDLNVITTQNGFGYRPDDAGNDAASATPLAGTELAGTFTIDQQGVIERNTDSDWYQFFAQDGPLTIDAIGGLVDSNLDISLELYDGSNNLVASNNPDDLLTASISYTVANSGSYYLKIDGVGKGDPLVDGYTDYASLGQYRLSGSFNTRYGSIEGVVFNDLNNNGVRNALEAGLPGRTLFVDVNNNGVFDATVQVIHSVKQVTIPEIGTATSTLAVGGVAAPISDLNVSVSINHTYTADLKLALEAPNGQRIWLARNVGGPGDNFLGTVFDDESEQGIAQGQGPFSGFFRPDESLAAFDGLDANGDWKLIVVDEAGGDIGQINGWSLGISTNGEPTATTDVNGNYRFINLKGDTYRIRSAPPSGWLVTAPATNLYTVALLSGQQVAGYDYGQVQSGRISGYVYRDTNANGARNDGEVGLANWLVYVDANNNSVMDANEIRVPTRASGEYVLEGLTAGTYRVREAVPSGYKLTQPSTGFYTVTVATGTNVTGRDFGNVFAPEVEVKYGGNVVLDNTGSINFGTTQVIRPVQRLLEVKNVGLAPLVLQPATVPAGFRIVQNFTANQSLAPGQSEFLTVELAATAAGSFSGPLSFATNDVDENPYNFTISGIVQPQDTFIIDDGAPGFTSTGTWSVKTGVGRDGDHRTASPDGGAASARWTFQNLTPGMYEVATTWVPGLGLAVDSPFRIIHGSESAELGMFRVNQEGTPNSFTDLGSPWYKLGTQFAVTGTSLIVQLTNQANDLVAADAIRIKRVGNLPTGGAEVAVFDGDRGEIADGTGRVDLGTTRQGVAKVRTLTVRNLGNAALTVQPIVAPAGFTIGNNFAANTVLAAGASRSITVTLTAATVGTFAGQLQFANSDSNENPYNFEIRGVVTASTVQIIDDGEPGFRTYGSWQTYNTLGRESDVAYTKAGQGENKAKWTFNVTPGVYKVAVTYPAGDVRATNAPFAIRNGEAGPLLGVYTLNQKLQPNDFTDAGSGWKRLGNTIQVTGTQLVVETNNKADGFVFADAVRIERVGNLPAAVPTSSRSAGSSSTASTSSVPLIAASKGLVAGTVASSTSQGSSAAASFSGPGAAGLAAQLDFALADSALADELLAI